MPSSYGFEIDQERRVYTLYASISLLSFHVLIYMMFNVSASGFSLLTNFSIGNGTSSPVIKEFLLTIPQGEFRIHFIPSQQSSLAFVNAIEVFLANETRIADDVSHVTSAGDNRRYSGFLSQALHTIGRITFGGSTFGGSPIEYDELWRSWVDDDSYLILNSDFAMNCTIYGQSPNYDHESVSNYTAPDRIYQSCKQLKPVSDGNSSLLNLTWRFPVSKNTKHFVRFHFCDIVGKTADDLQFNLYIYRDFDKTIDPYFRTNTSVIASPFFIDYVVDSDDSGFTNFSISPSEQYSSILNAFLNGLEIMEFLNKSCSIPEEYDESMKKHFKHVNVIMIIGSVSSGAFVIFITVVALRLKCTKAESDQSLEGLLYGGRLTEGSATGSPPSSLNLSLRISFAEIQYATKKFNAKLLIGEGGFGKVYKGTFRNGMKVAVKRSQAGHGQGIEEFQTEIMVLSQIRHGHLVSLIGYCDEGSEMILVYEFMEKGSLKSKIFSLTSNKAQNEQQNGLNGRNT